MSTYNNSLPPILRLPPELRLRIYRLLLLSDQTVRMTWRQDDESCPRPNCLFPAILRTCRVIHNEAIDVLYGENDFRAHRINDANINTASIRHAKFVIGINHAEDGEHDASLLQGFLESHPSLESLVFEFGLRSLEDSTLRDHIIQVLFRSRYSSKVKVRSAVQSSRSRYNAMQIKQVVETTAIMLKEFPEDFKRISDNVKKQNVRSLEVNKSLKEKREY